jgi:ribosomal protein L17
MAFQPGNQEAKKADHGRRKLVTQQLISALNEAADDKDTPKVRKIVDALIDKARGGDIAAIKEIFDRVEGKPTQPIAGDDDAPPIRLEQIVRTIVEPARNPDSESVPPAS